MTRVDFYQLSRDPVEDALPLIAAKALAGGKRMVIVSANEAQQQRISEALWARADSFLAHGTAGGESDQHQPILLASDVAQGNGATILALADGVWRETGEFERILLLFDAATVAGARIAWKALGDTDAERHFWKQDGGKWVEGP